MNSSSYFVIILFLLLGFLSCADEDSFTSELIKYSTFVYKDSLLDKVEYMNEEKEILREINFDRDLGVKSILDYKHKGYSTGNRYTEINERHYNSSEKTNKKVHIHYYNSKVMSKYIDFEDDFFEDNMEYYNYDENYMLIMKSSYGKGLVHYSSETFYYEDSLLSKSYYHEIDNYDSVIHDIISRIAYRTDYIYDAESNLKEKITYSYNFKIEDLPSIFRKFKFDINGNIIDSRKYVSDRLLNHESFKFDSENRLIEKVDIIENISNLYRYEQFEGFKGYD